MTQAPSRSRRFDPQSREPFRLSRSKLQLFLECPRCFYLDRRLGVGRPSGPPFSLNNTVDTLLKREFDQHRARGEPHPLMRTYGVDAIPLSHPLLPEWREPFRGVSFLHPTGLILFGAVDDVWVDPKGNLIVVDYKATSTTKEVTLDGEYREAYKRQMEVYQWLLRRNGFSVSDRGYFVYVNADKDRQAFDRKLEFSVHVLPYDGSDAWVEEAVREAYACLQADQMPPYAEACEWCAYRRKARENE